MKTTRRRRNICQLKDLKTGNKRSCRCSYIHAHIFICMTAWSVNVKELVGCKMSGKNSVQNVISMTTDLKENREQELNFDKT